MSFSDLSGFDRLRLRAHRRRHRQKHTDTHEIDELHDMLVHESRTEDADEVANEEREEQTHGPRRIKVGSVLEVNIVSEYFQNTAIKKERNEALCASTRETVELNTAHFEFDPPFIVHVKCKNQADYENGLTTKLEEQVILSIEIRGRYILMCSLVWILSRNNS